MIATEMSHPPRFAIPEHAHDLPSFYVLINGALTEFAGRRSHALGSGGVAFTPAGHVHRNVFHERGGRCLLVELTPAWHDRLASAGMGVESPVFRDGGPLTFLGMSLYRELWYADAVSALAVEGLTLELLAAFARLTEPVPHDVPPWLGRAHDLLVDRFAERLVLAEIAHEVGVHPVHLARSFRRAFRCTPGEFQRRIRVERACRELASTRHSLSRIALDCGFFDQAHFSRVFRQETGWTPGRYRAAFRGG